MNFQEKIASLSMKEWHIVEQTSGSGMGILGDESTDTPRAAFYASLAWVLKKREDATFTKEQADSLTLNEVNEILGLNEQEPTGEDAADLGNDES